MIGKGVALAGMLCVMPVLSHTVILESGRVHLRGQLVNGACTVATDSQDMRVQMGQYRTNAFSGTGSFASTSVPFSLRLTSCSSDVYDHVRDCICGRDASGRSAGFFLPAAMRLRLRGLAWHYLTSANGKLYRMPCRFIMRRL